MRRVVLVVRFSNVLNWSDNFTSLIDVPPDEPRSETDCGGFSVFFYSVYK